MPETVVQPRRLFIAIHVRPMPDVLELLGKLRQLGRSLRPVAPDNLHLTLRFLGAVSEALQAGVSEALVRAAQSSAAMELTLRTTGAFPDFNRPKVIWAGVDEHHALNALVASLSAELAQVGIGPEQQPFHPHVTLARVKKRPPATLASLYRRFATHTFGTWMVKEVHLLSSELTPNGPKYDAVRSVRLGEARL